MTTRSYDLIVFLLATTTIILLLTSLVVIILYYHGKKQLDFSKNLENLKVNHEKELMSTKLEIQEETFQYVAKEIHDNINLSLTLAKLHLSSQSMLEGASHAKIEEVVEILSKVIEDLGGISKRLGSDTIESYGLVPALNFEVERIRKAQLFNIVMSVIGEPEYFESQTELIIFRIVQEAFNNIIKHAHASNVELCINYIGSGVFITISDDGSGFDERNTESKAKGAGLRNMATRSKMIGGEIMLSSKRNEGTVLTLKVPSLANE